MSGVDQQRLRDAVRESGRSARAISLAAGLGATAVKDILSGKSKEPAASTLAAIETELGLPAGALLGEATGTPRARTASTFATLPLLGPIQAGAWLAVDEHSQAEPEVTTAVRDARYPHARQWLRPVVGDSMNALDIVDGHLAHIVDFAEAGIRLNTGNIVEVTRYRDDGSLREITLKQVEVVADGYLLWPRSTNPRWSEPLRYTDGADGQEVEVRVTGLLLATTRRF